MVNDCWSHRPGLLSKLQKQIPKWKLSHQASSLLGICTEPGMSAETQRVGTVLAFEEVTIQSGWRVDS